MIYSSDLMQVPKVSHGISGKYCKPSVFLNIFRYPDYGRPALHCSTNNHISHDDSYQKYGLFFSFVGS